MRISDCTSDVCSSDLLLGRSLDAWPTVMTGSGGRHHYMIVPEGFLAMDSVADFPGIEFKGHGRQVVAPGSSHPNTGKPYVWIADEFAPSSSEARLAPDVRIGRASCRRGVCRDV